VSSGNLSVLTIWRELDSIQNSHLVEVKTLPPTSLVAYMHHGYYLSTQLLASNTLASTAMEETRDMGGRIERLLPSTIIALQEGIHL
jgi:hypothetical protein